MRIRFICALAGVCVAVMITGASVVAPAGAAVRRGPVCPSANPNGNYALVAIAASPVNNPSSKKHRGDIRRMNSLLHQGAVDSGRPEGADFVFACDDQGMTRVDQAVLPTPDYDASYATIVRDLKALGYDKPNEKYVVFYGDDYYYVNHTGICGQAQRYNDDTAGPDNLNNSGPSYAVDFNCGWKSMMHELGHVLGADEPTSPHATGLGHCWDGNQITDIMCYDDGGPFVPVTGIFTCPGKVAIFDCNHDDYFDAQIGAGEGNGPGSYLDTHWNIGGCYVRFIVEHGTCPGSGTADSLADAVRAPAAAFDSLADLAASVVPYDETDEPVDAEVDGDGAATGW